MRPGVNSEFTLDLMFTKFEADRLRQNTTYITTKDSGFRVSLPLVRRRCITCNYHLPTFVQKMQIVPLWYHRYTSLYHNLSISSKSLSLYICEPAVILDLPYSMVQWVQEHITFSPSILSEQYNLTQWVLGPMKGGQSVECQGQIFGNVVCQLENGSVECRLNILWPVAYLPHLGPR